LVWLNLSQTKSTDREYPAYREILIGLEAKKRPPEQELCKFHENLLDSILLLGA